MIQRRRIVVGSIGLYFGLFRGPFGASPIAVRICVCTKDNLQHQDGQDHYKVHPGVNHADQSRLERAWGPQTNTTMDQSPPDR